MSLQERARELSVEALHAAMRNDWDAAAAAMQALSNETGGPGIRFALTAFCDWLITAQNRVQGKPDFDAPGIVRPAWLNAETGQVDTSAGDVPPAARWAGQLAVARAAMDKPAFDALLASMPEDGLERGRYAAALLEGCAASVNALQEGAP